MASQLMTFGGLRVVLLTRSEPDGGIGAELRLVSMGLAAVGRSLDEAVLDAREIRAMINMSLGERDFIAA